jgi:hypothetical protein
MIVQDKVFVYQKYDGDYDRWMIRGNLMEKSVIQDTDWLQIQELLMDLSTVKNGTAHPPEILEIKKKMDTLVDSDPTRKLLFDLA